MVDHTEMYAFKDGKNFTFDGTIDSLPDWADRGWMSYHYGPALAVPKGDPLGQPYTTTYAHKGDTIVMNKAGDRFIVVTADPTDADAPASNLPAQTTAASLEDLQKTGHMDPADLTDEQKAQMAERAAGSGAPVPDAAADKAAADKKAADDKAEADKKAAADAASKKKTS